MINYIVANYIDILTFMNASIYTYFEYTIVMILVLIAFIALGILFTLFFETLNRTIKSITRYISHSIILKPDPFDEEIYNRWSNKKNLIKESIKTIDGELLDAMFYNKSKNPSYENDIIYLYHHGNTGWIGLVLESNTCKYLTNYGSLFVYDYRGYGKSTGKPTDDGLFIDSVSVWNFLVKEKKVDPKRIIMFGHSLGSSVLSNLTKHLLENNKKYSETLILQNPFSSIDHVCNDIVPWVGKFVQLDFKTDETFSQIDKLTSNLKIFIIHSDEDELINKSHSYAIASRIKNNKNRIIIVPGTHDDPEYTEEVHKVLTKVLTKLPIKTKGSAF
jgi:predicted esterase